MPNGWRPPVKWWGWGAPGTALEPSPEFLDRLRTSLRADLRRRREPPREPPRLPAARPVKLPLPAIADDATRLQYAAGRSYLDLVQLRRPALSAAPDGVVFPQSPDDVRALLGQRSVAVVPFGGGTSVVGGVAPRRGTHDAVVAMDMSALREVLAFDRESMTIRVGAGMFGPELQRIASAEGLTLGHFPQSFEYSTVGGWIVTRSAGQESTRYGRIEDAVVALTVLTPAGEIRTIAVPRSAAGPDVRQIMLGSEGTYGVVVDATLRLHRIAARRLYRSYLFRDFADGVAAVRELLQSGAKPAVLRLSDETETQLAFDLHRTSPALQSVLRQMGRRPGAHLLLAFDGSPAAARHQAAEAYRAARRAGGLPLGSSPGKQWSRERFQHPYLRDSLLDHEVFVETFETATVWSNLLPLRDIIRRAVGGLVACHISHAYEEGASLYFTVFDTAATGAEEEQWRAFKAGATNAIVAGGGTISHHHSVGVDHKAWLEGEKGALALEMLMRVKQQLDPAGIMNPEKLL